MVGDEWTRPEELETLKQWAMHSRIAVELGTWTGRSAHAILQGMDAAGEGVLFCVDHFRGTVEVDVEAYAGSDPVYVKAVCVDRLQNWMRRGRCFLLDMSFAEAFEGVVDGRSGEWTGGPLVDLLGKCGELSRAGFCFIDGEHSYEACKEDIVRCRGIARIGGVICGHDFTYDGVRQAVVEAFGSKAVKTGPGSLWRVDVT